MKIIVYILTLVVATSTSGCSGEFERYPVQGRWKIESVLYQREGKPDSVVSANLGSIAFNHCSQESNKLQTCTGARTYADKNTDNFFFRTRRSVHENQPVQVLDITSENNLVADELMGTYRIEKLTDQELVLVCTKCGVGRFPDPLTRFELRATKVPE